MHNKPDSTAVQHKSISKPGPWPEPPTGLIKPIGRGELRTAKLFPPTGRAVARLLSRLKDEATDNPEEIRKAQEELDEMKRSMNDERIRSGAEPIF